MERRRIAGRPVVFRLDEKQYQDLRKIAESKGFLTGTYLRHLIIEHINRSRSRRK